jgi:hypothetical protein
MSKEFPYKTYFDCPIQLMPIGAESFISKASLDNLKPLIPKDIDFKENIDLLGLAYNAAVINMFNKNDDGMDSATAAKVIKNFLHKPTNIEHDKSKVVGHIVNAGFSKFEDDNQLLNIDEIMSMKDPFNISLGSVFYKYANKDFTKLIMRSLDPQDSMHNEISASWEVGFSDYSIALGSDNLKEAEIITNPTYIKEMKSNLKMYGGNGRLKDGTRVYRLLSGEIYPLGIGFTSNPAAKVKGIVGDDNESEIVEIKDKRDKKTYFDLKKINFNKKTNEAISQIAAANVKHEKETIMDVEKILSEVQALLVEKKFSEEAVASMSSVFADAIKQKDAEYRASLTKAEDEKTAIAKEQEELRASVSDLQAKLSDATQKITEFENFKKQEEAVARFNSRMEVIDQAYELDDEDRKVLADDLKGLGDSEEAFASYQGKLAIMWRGKNKEAKASLDKSIQERIDAEVAKKLSSISQASETKSEETDKEVAENALDKAEASDKGIPNSNEEASRTQPTLREKFASAFTRESIVIS